MAEYSHSEPLDSKRTALLVAEEIIVLTYSNFIKNIGSKEFSHALRKGLKISYLYILFLLKS